MSCPDTDFTTSLTPSSMRELRELSESDQEHILFGRIQYIASVWELSFGEVGLICREVQNYLLHEQRIDPDTGEPCSFARWIHLAAPRSYSTVYSAMRAVEELKDIPDEQVARIRSSNFPIMTQLSTEVRNDPEVLKVAQTGRSEDLVEHVQRNHPNQHVEHRKLLRFTVEESAAVIIEHALKMAQFHGAANQAQALEAICQEAIALWEAEDEVLRCASETKDTGYIQ